MGLTFHRHGARTTPNGTAIDAGPDLAPTTATGISPRPDSGPPVSGHRTRMAALYLIAIIVVTATAIAFVQSYDGLYQWASRYLDEGWARTWPLQVDAWIAVGELTLYVAYRDRWPARRKLLPWLAAVTGLAVSTVFNIGHMTGVDLAGHVTAAVPPVAAFAGLALGLQVLKYVEETHHVHSARREDASEDIHRESNGRRPNEQRRHSDLLTEAKALLKATPGLTGQQLGHSLAVSERTGRRLRRRLADDHQSA